jgi:predicted aspartyl protease
MQLFIIFVGDIKNIDFMILLINQREIQLGRTSEKVLIKNYIDIALVDQGYLKPSEIRSIEIDAIVDTGAAYLCLPPKAIKELGLPFAFNKPVRTGNGKLELRIFRGAEITIKDRTIDMQVMENIDDNVPALIGYLVLETMDWVVDPKSQEIIGNPLSDGKWVIDMY